MAATFSCVCCCDDHASAPIQIQDSKVCLECFQTGILPQFEDAINDETQYPVKWGRHELNLRDYVPHVPPDLLTRWSDKLKEYQTSVQDRLYCRGTITSTPRRTQQRCTAFLGSKRHIRETVAAPTVVLFQRLPSRTTLAEIEAMVTEGFGRLTEIRLLRADPEQVVELTFVDAVAAQQFLTSFHGARRTNGVALHVCMEVDNIAHAKGRIVTCHKCATEVCSKCSKALSEAQTHDCDLNPDDDPFRGLVRGRDYQQCPTVSCQVKVALRDGCNHMQCSYCQSEFCFICGAEVSDASGHWKVGKPCPRWGLPGTSRAIHDTDATVEVQEIADRGIRRRIRRAIAEAEEAIMLLEAAQRQEARDREHARLMNFPEYRLMLEDQSQLRHLIVWLSTQDPADRDPLHQLLTLLLTEMEVHAAHLRRSESPTPYSLRRENQLANGRIQAAIRAVGLARLNPTLMGIISRYNDAWDGQAGILNLRFLGRLRIAHRTVIRELLRQLPRDFIPQWIDMIRELCHLLEAGLDHYVYEYRASAESRQLSTLMHELIHPRYLELLSALQNYHNIMARPLAKGASDALAPVIEAYGLAVDGDIQTLRLRFVLRPMGFQHLRDVVAFERLTGRLRPR